MDVPDPSVADPFMRPVFISLLRPGRRTCPSLPVAQERVVQVRDGARPGIIPAAPFPTGGHVFVYVLCTFSGCFLLPLQIPFLFGLNAFCLALQPRFLPRHHLFFSAAPVLGPSL